MFLTTMATTSTGLSFGDMKLSPDQEIVVRNLADPVWRISSGALYKIMVKSDGGEGTVIPFIPNRAQRRLLKRLWHRNVILKARQLGFTTLVAIMWLDHAIFNSDQRVGIIAQDREAAEAIFRDKVKLAYDRLPEFIRQAAPLAAENKSEILFAHNNSSVRVATSMRSGTIHRLHVSEFGKICAKFPDKANEVVTGSLPAVPLDGIAIIESTAEGQDGEFYKMTQRAMAHHEAGVTLTERDYRFHFYAWHKEPTYRMDPSLVVITDKDREYFESIEYESKCSIDDSQRAWYVATRDADFSGDPEKMWQEYPSTPKEAFQQSTEGTYYAVQLAAARKAGRIGLFPHAAGVPVNTFWDIGNSDGTAIWFHQRIGGENRFIKFIEGWGEAYSYYIQKMQALGYVWGTHYLPHDGDHKRQMADIVASPIEILRKFEIGGKWSIVPRVGDVIDGIQVTRDIFSTCTFDEEGCKEGLAHLSQYRKDWNARLGCWSDKPRHDVHSEAADALRQFAQSHRNIKSSIDNNDGQRRRRPAPNWRA
ncbi:MAG: terminase [Betaproteobacteria bacterium]